MHGKPTYLYQSFRDVLKLVDNEIIPPISKTEHSLVLLEK